LWLLTSTMGNLNVADTLVFAPFPVTFDDM
jgi:hypothetical protein